MTKPKPVRGWPPKGSYPHPDGGFIHHGPVRPGQKIRLTGHLRAKPDIKKLASAFVQLAEQQERERRERLRDKKKCS